jgi:hypothetical protein
MRGGGDWKFVMGGGVCVLKMKLLVYLLVGKFGQMYER